MILPILAYGDPILKKECDEIDDNYSDLKKLISDMFETMYKAKGVGLAAPQIGKNIRLFIVDGSPFSEDEGEDEDPLADGISDFKKVFINPIIEFANLKLRFHTMMKTGNLKRRNMQVMQREFFSTNMTI